MTEEQKDKKGKPLAPASMLGKAKAKVQSWKSARDLIAKAVVASVAAATVATAAITAAALHDTNARVDAVEARPPGGPAFDDSVLVQRLNHQLSVIEALQGKAERLQGMVQRLADAPSPSPGPPGPPGPSAPIQTAVPDLTDLRASLAQNATDIRSLADDLASAQAGAATTGDVVAIADQLASTTDALTEAIGTVASNDAAGLQSLADSLGTVSTELATASAEITAVQQDVVAAQSAAEAAQTTADGAAALAELARSLVPAGIAFSQSGTATYSVSGITTFPGALFIRTGPTAQHLVTFSINLSGCAAQIQVSGVPGALVTPVGTGRVEASAFMNLTPGNHQVVVGILTTPTDTPCTYDDPTVVAQRILSGTVNP